MQPSLNTNKSHFLSLIGDDLEKVKKLICQQITGNSESIGQLLNTFNRSSGKMLRPALVLLSGKCCGKITDDHIKVAAVLEMIHNATLLHDDVIDDGQKRRGLPTTNKLWGNEAAVLLGDFLLSKACRMCADMGIEVNKKVTEITATVCQGELRQIIQKQNWQLSESEYIDIVTEKSASLFSGCCFLGAYLAQANQELIESLSGYGLNLGIAFQIIDDLFDISGNEEKLGKTLGRDFEKKKLTLPVIHLLKTIDQSKKDALLVKLNTASLNRESLIDILSDLGSLEYARNRAQEFIGKAISSLIPLKESEARKALTETARFVVDRAA